MSEFTLSSGRIVLIKTNNIEETAMKILQNNNESMEELTWLETLLDIYHDEYFFDDENLYYIENLSERDCNDRLYKLEILNDRSISFVITTYDEPFREVLQQAMEELKEETETNYDKKVKELNSE